ncbi:MAG TPA: YkgJ family cysteine cluster protein [Granulicella sp.]
MQLSILPIMDAASHSTAEAPAEVQVDFTLQVGKGQLQVSLPVPTANVTLTQLLPVLQNLTSSIIDSVVHVVHEEGYQISCRAGCGACCSQLVPLSLFEAEALTTWIRSLPPERQQHLEQRFHDTLLALRDAGILEHFNPSIWDESTPETRAFAMDYLAQKVPCPFLENQSCSIHPIRPLVCREYLVTSPAEYCAAPTNETVSPIPLPVKPSRLLYQFGAYLEPNTHGWIPLVFLFAWMKSNAHPGDEISGPGPELLYEFIKRL